MQTKEPYLYLELSKGDKTAEASACYTGALGLWHHQCPQANKCPGLFLIQDPGQSGAAFNQGDPVREAFQMPLLEPLEPRESPARQPLTCFLEPGKGRSLRWQTFLSQGQENRRPPGAVWRESCSHQSHKCPQGDLPLSSSELAATHSPPKMYSDFLVTIYSPTRRVL